MPIIRTVGIIAKPGVPAGVKLSAGRNVAFDAVSCSFVAERDADRSLEVLRAHPTGAGACRIGKVSDQHTQKVVLRSAIGTQRILDMSTGEQLPRIC